MLGRASEHVRHSVEIVREQRKDGILGRTSALHDRPILLRCRLHGLEIVGAVSRFERGPLPLRDEDVEERRERVGRIQALFRVGGLP